MTKCPWGSWVVLDEGPRHKVKRLTITPGGSLSLQSHYHRAERWTVIAGTAEITVGDSVSLAFETDTVWIPATVRHRLRNPGMIDCEVIEVQMGSYLGEDDITRYEDEYGRA